METFKLYPYPEKATFSLQDYATLASLAYGKKNVLEIGPGISTFALIEAGVEKIVTLEHDDEWFDRAVGSLEQYPHVHVRRYWDEVPCRAELHAEDKFELAFVDSPKGFNKPVQGIKGVRKIHPGLEDCSRLNTCLLALEYAPIVLLHDAYRPVERATAGRLSAMGHEVEYLQGSKCGILKIKRKDSVEEFADTTGKAKAIWQKLDNSWSTGLSKT